MGEEAVSRAADRVSKRAAVLRGQERWLDDCARAERAETERAAVATRLRELSEKVRTGPYAGRAADLEEVDRLWSDIARRSR